MRSRRTMGTSMTVLSRQTMAIHGMPWQTLAWLVAPGRQNRTSLGLRRQGLARLELAFAEVLPRVDELAFDGRDRRRGGGHEVALARRVAHAALVVAVRRRHADLVLGEHAAHPAEA